MSISLDIQKCLKHNVKVYPVIKDRKTYIQVRRPDGSLVTYDKPVSGNGINEAMEKTYRHWANEGIVNFYNRQK